jgi:hypothetical protein
MKDKVEVAEVQGGCHQAAVTEFRTAHQMAGGFVHHNRALRRLWMLEAAVEVENGAGGMTECHSDFPIQSLALQRLPVRNPLIGAHRPDHFGIPIGCELIRYEIGKCVSRPQREHPAQDASQADAEFAAD